MRALSATFLLVGAATLAAPAFAHVVGDAVVHEPLGWTWDPWIVAPLAASAALFATGWSRLARRARLGIPRLRRRAASFAAGWLVLAAALVSPLHAWGEHGFAAHMVEHELLMLVAAPLLVLAQPSAILLWAFGSTARRRIGRFFAGRAVVSLWRSARAPVVATTLQAAALWLWHAPALFDRALADDGWHAVQHLSFVVTALLFWTAMLERRATASSDAAARGVAALCLFATSIVSGALGALMAFSTSPWYAGYARLGLTPYGLMPAEDQQLAGLLMWIPGGLVHAIVALVLVRTVLAERPVGGGLRDAA